MFGVFFFVFFLMFLFIWFPWVLVVALGIFSCSIWDLGFPGGSTGKESARRPGFDPLVGRIPWRRAWQPILVFWPVEFHGERSLEGCSRWGRKESDTTEVT